MPGPASCPVSWRCPRLLDALAARDSVPSAGKPVANVGLIVQGLARQLAWASPYQLMCRRSDRVERAVSAENIVESREPVALRCSCLGKVATSQAGRGQVLLVQPVLAPRQDQIHRGRRHVGQLSDPTKDGQ